MQRRQFIGDPPGEALPTQRLCGFANRVDQRCARRLAELHQTGVSRRVDANRGRDHWGKSTFCMRHCTHRPQSDDNSASVPGATNRREWTSWEYSRTWSGRSECPRSTVSPRRFPARRGRLGARGVHERSPRQHPSRGRRRGRETAARFGGEGPERPGTAQRPLTRMSAAVRFARQCDRAPSASAPPVVHQPQRRSPSPHRCRRRLGFVPPGDSRSCGTDALS